MQTEPEATKTIDYNTPPLAAVTGVVGLRNGEERAVWRRVYDSIIEDAVAGSWTLDGERHRGWRHPEDIVAQVSVGPTGPGRYETASGAAITLDGHDKYGWRSPWDGGLWDEFGRYFLSGKRRRAGGDLRRRIGDLPEPEAVPAEVQEFAAAVERAMEAAKTAEPYRDACLRMLGCVTRVLHSDGREGVLVAKDDLPHLVTALANAVGKRECSGTKLVDGEWVPVSHAEMADDLAEPASPPAPAVVTNAGVYRDTNGWGWRVVPVGDGWGGEGHRRNSWLLSGAGVEPGVPALVERVGGLELWDPACVRDTSGPWSCCKPDELAEMVANYSERVLKAAGWRAVYAPSYPASDGRAAMDAMWGDGVPTVDLRTRDWLRELLIGTAIACRSNVENDFALSVSRKQIIVCDGDSVPVPRDDLRVLFERAWSAAELDHVLGEAQGYVIAEAVYRALSRAAAALGETLPEWMREHAKREGWT